jgi:hypothetical protein
LEVDEARDVLAHVVVCRLISPTCCFSNMFCCIIPLQVDEARDVLAHVVLFLVVYSMHL